MTTIDLYNSHIRISSPTEELKQYLTNELSFKDKSKQYQLKKMKKNPFLRKTPAYAKLMQEAEGCLLEEQDGDLIIPSGFAYLFDGQQVNDYRQTTGDLITLPWKDSSAAIQLRDFQQEAVDTASKSYRGIINMPTGTGKTKTFIYLIREIKKKTLIVCPSKGVAKQIYDELCLVFGKTKIGFIGDSIYKPSDVTVGIAASLKNRVKEISKWNLGVVIFDECHHTPANTFFILAKSLSYVERMYGFTATSFRSDGKDILITAGCGNIIYQKEIRWFIEKGWLAKPYFLVRKVDTKGRDFPDDKLKSYKEHVLKSKEMTERIEKDAKAMIASGRSTLILVDTIEHGEELSKVLGVPFAKGEDKLSEEYVSQLNKGKIKGLVGTEGKLSEGVDTRNVDCLILANFAGSKGMVIQAVGRGLRKQGTKENCIILDYIPNATMLKRHANNRIKWYSEITDDVKVIE